MKLLRTVKPGQRGTINLLKTHGSRLVKVRYYFDKAANRNIKTVELIESSSVVTDRKKRIPANKKVRLFIKIGERELQHKIKSRGGTWDPENKVWWLSYKSVCDLKLTRRIREDIAAVK